MKFDLHNGLGQSLDLYAILSSDGHLKALSQGWKRTFLNVKTTSGLFDCLALEGRIKFKGLIERGGPVLIKLMIGHEFRTIRFARQELDQKHSLISGIDITNDLSHPYADLTNHKMLYEVFKQAPCLAAVTLGEDFKFTFANALYRRLVGDRDIIGLPLKEAIPSLDTEVWNILKNVYNTGEMFEAKDLNMTADWNNDGSLTDRYFTLVYSPLKNNTGEVIGVWTFAFDTTESMRTQSLLEVTKRVSAMGAMAADVAHEINNPLTYVMGSVQVLRRTTETNAKTAKLLDNTSHGLSRIREIVKNLKGLSREYTQEFSHFCILEALEEGLRYAQITTSKVAHVTVNCDKNVMYYGCRGELVQIILNLVINASNAMPERKKLDNRIEIVATYCSKTKNTVLITIEDNGRGIEDSKLSKIFDPFYTSKNSTESTGLGLALCQKMVHQMKGSITVQSQLGVGTKFEISLPVNMDKNS